MIAFEVAAVDTMDALGMVAGVPDRLVVEYLEDIAAEAEVVGTLFEPDSEAVNALSPDLIIVGGRSVDSSSRCRRSPRDRHDRSGR